jgi:hypothetical protein
MRVIGTHEQCGEECRRGDCRQKWIKVDFEIPLLPMKWTKLKQNDSIQFWQAYIESPPIIKEHNISLKAICEM